MKKKMKKATKNSAERNHKIASGKLHLPKEILSESDSIKKIKIRVIGIGGGGGSIVAEIAAKMPKASFVAANTDLQALKTLGKRVIRLPFGENLTKGLGAGMNAELGREAALKEKDKIQKILEGQDLCIFVACLGGGAGSGAVPVFAKIARDLGNLTYGIFTLPFKFEGERKTEIALDALKKVKNNLNAFSIIPNERVFQTINKDTPLKHALSIINKNLADSLGGLIETLYLPGLINIDFADFKTILEGQGRLTYLNTVEVQRKEGSIREMTEKVLESQFYPYGIKGAKGVLFNIAGEKNLSLAEVSQISKTISDLVSQEAKIIFGISQNQKQAETIKTTILASGCGLKIASLPKKAVVKKPKKKRLKPVEIMAKKEEKQGVKNEEQASHKNTQQKTGAKKPRQITMKIKRKKNEKLTPVASLEEELPQLDPGKAIAPKQPVMQIVNQEQVRRNALQVKKEAEEEEREMLERESLWDTPAFLRRKLIKDR